MIAEGEDDRFFLTRQHCRVRRFRLHRGIVDEGPFTPLGNCLVVQRIQRGIEAGVEPARTSRGERYAMNENSNIVPLRQPDEIDDPLTNILRSGARQLLAQAVEIEAEAFLAAMKDLKLADGRDRLVRHGHGPDGRSRRESVPSRSSG